MLNSIAGSFQNIALFRQNNVTSLIWCKFSWKENMYSSLDYLEHHKKLSTVSILLLVSDGVWHDVHLKPWQLDQTVFLNKTKCNKRCKIYPKLWLSSIQLIKLHEKNVQCSWNTRWLIKIVVKISKLSLEVGNLLLWSFIFRYFFFRPAMSVRTTSCCWCLDLHNYFIDI